MHLKERGAAALEYLGVVVAVVVIIGGLAMTSAGPQVAAYIGDGICRVGSQMPGAGPCTLGDDIRAEHERDYAPDSCQASSSGSRHAVSGSVAWIRGGVNHEVGIAEVRNADGTVDYVVTHNGGGEVGAGIKGPRAKSDDDAAIEASIGADFGVDATYAYGREFKVSSPEEAQELADALERNPLSNHGHLPLTDSHIVGAQGTVSVDLGLGVDGTAIGGNVDLHGSHTYETMTNSETGDTTYITTWDGSAEFSGDAAGAANGEQTWEGATSMAVTRDANGQITGLTFETVSHSGNNIEVFGQQVGGEDGNHHVTTADLAVTDENRAVVEQYLDNGIGNYMHGKPFAAMGLNPLEASSDPMGNLLYQEAVVTQLEVAQSENEDTPWWGLGLYSRMDLEGNVINAQYAGAPTDGRRGWENMEVCFG